MLGTCQVCGKPVKPPKTSYCSEECYNVAKKRRHAELQRVWRAKRKQADKSESLNNTIAEASAAGMSYGKYKAMQYIDKQRKENGNG